MQSQRLVRATPNGISPFGTIALLGFASIAVAHGHDEHPGLVAEASSASSSTKLETYFQCGGYSGWIIFHIVVMSVAWCFLLPIGVILSISRSRYRMTIQILFLFSNVIGIFPGIIYNANTPDLYANNAHHKLGWVVTGISVTQVAVGIISLCTRRKGSYVFIPITQRAMTEHQQDSSTRREPYRFSYDSGHGTSADTESRSPSCSADSCHSPRLQHIDDGEKEQQGLIDGNKVDRILSRILSGTLPTLVYRVFNLFYDVVDRVILILGFAALCTGWITYGGLFKGEAVFSGLAHFIKGGVFFWYGILTLGRWAGSFADIGWAWNIKPASAKANRPTAEFAESFLIFFYGSTNVFLEHLNAWGKEWSAMDLEHISLTIMFIGGGLCGMLIESKRLRDFLNTRQETPLSQLHFSADKESLEEPASYRFPMNPIPALIILLLGIMMSSHHQESMVSTMVHSQWGNLLVGAAVARGATYVLYYLAPPKSVLPGRPPTELITSFCLMAGGLIFMASARDIVETIELYKLDAMFVFTVSMGLITFLMAWVIAVIAIKGWAVRKENKSYTYDNAA